ncbi:MAG: hypothetical protein V3575_03410 [Candidatus Absconditabacteria bacterium]
MEKELKQLIHSIFTNPSKSIDEKYLEIIKHFPNYLDYADTKKTIYEKIEGIFHDGLGTYFEYLVYDELNNYFELGLKAVDKNRVLDKLNLGKSLYNKFFVKNEYKINFDKEIENIKKGAKESINFINQYTLNNKIKNITLSSQDFRVGNSRDLYIDLDNGKQLNFSLKTDKSGKVALFEGQTPDIFTKVYKRYFLLTEDEYKSIKIKLFNTEDEKIIFEDFQNVALLTQTVILVKLGLENAKINNFKYATITNQAVLNNLIEKLKYYKSGDDESIILLVNRETGNIGAKTILDDIDLQNLNLKDFSLTPCIPRGHNYATEPGIKYKGKTFVSFQVKHKRGSNSSEKFQDITIRLRTKK